MTRYQQLKKKDLILRDLAYGTVKGIAHVREQKADYVFRLKANSFTLYTAEYKKFDLAKCLEEEWAPGKLLLSGLCKILVNRGAFPPVEK